MRGCILLGVKRIEENEWRTYINQGFRYLNLRDLMEEEQISKGTVSVELATQVDEAWDIFKRLHAVLAKKAFDPSRVNLNSKDIQVVLNVPYRRLQLSPDGHYEVHGESNDGTRRTSITTYVRKSSDGNHLVGYPMFFGKKLVPHPEFIYS